MVGIIRNSKLISKYTKTIKKIQLNYNISSLQITKRLNSVCNLKTKPTATPAEFMVICNANTNKFHTMQLKTLAEK